MCVLKRITICWSLLSLLFNGATAPRNLGLLIVEASRLHSDKPHAVGLLWMSDQPDAYNSTSKHTTVTTDRHPYPRRDSNPQASGRRVTP